MSNTEQQHKCLLLKQQEVIRVYPHTSENVAGGGWIEKDGEIFTLVFLPVRGKYTAKIKIDFCPFCGERLV